MAKRIFKYVLLSLLFFILILVGLINWPLSYLKPRSLKNSLLITNVAVVDVVGDTIIQDQYVLIQDKRIQAIMQEKPDSLGENVVLINGQGKYLIPALWDMHAHTIKLSPYVSYPMFIANGVTNIRDMRGSFNENDPFVGGKKRIEAWNKAVNAYELVGPRVQGVPSFAVEGPHAMFEGKPDIFQASSPEKAVELVRFLKKSGVDFIKVYNNLPRASFFALMEEAKRQKMEVVGHKPLRVSAIEAAEAGMKSIEHARVFLWEAFPEADKLRKNENPGALDNTILRRQMLDQHDSAMAARIFKAFVKNDTWFCPTHLTRKADAFANDSLYRNSEKIKELNPVLRFLAEEDLDETVREDTSAMAGKTYMDFYMKSLEITGKAHRHGVGILAGSDMPEFPGVSLHEELQELTLAGLSPIDVLRTATLNPALYYNVVHDYGSVDEGKVADLLLLAKNPLEEVANLKSIEAVFFEGVYYNKAELERMKESTRKLSQSYHVTAKLLWDMVVFMAL